MLSRYQKIIFSIILMIAFSIQGCGGNIPVPPAKVTLTTPEILTPQPTQTLSPEPPATNTATPDGVATANILETASIGTLVSAVQATVIGTYPSPDRKWRVEVIRYDCAYVSHDYNEAIAYEQVKLINLGDATEKILADQKQNCGGLGAFGFNGLYWSPSNRYFYYNDSREGFPDGGCGSYIPLPIYRLDTANRKIIKLEGGFLAPDKTKLALWQGQDILIWDLDKGEIARVTSLKPDFFHSRIWWSENSHSLVYRHTQNECSPNFGKSYLVSLDLTNLSQNVIAEYEITDQGFVSTPAPAGVFVFYFYSPLIMNYDPSLWEIKNGLQAKQLASCSITEQGPTDFYDPHTTESVQLGNVRYEVMTFSDSSPNDVRHLYLADQAHATDSGLPVFWVTAKNDEWNKCEPLAEKVLATLHFPL